TNGQENLLRQVLLAAANSLSNQYLLITDARSNTVHYDRTVRMFSSVAFGFNGKLRMYPDSVDFAQNGAVLRVTNVLWWTNSLNPFVHTFHQDHNNLDDSSPPAALAIDPFLDPNWLVN